MVLALSLVPFYTGASNRIRAITPLGRWKRTADAECQSKRVKERKPSHSRTLSSFIDRLRSVRTVLTGSERTRGYFNIPRSGYTVEQELRRPLR